MATILGCSGEGVSTPLEGFVVVGGTVVDVDGLTVIEGVVITGFDEEDNVGLTEVEVAIDVEKEVDEEVLEAGSFIVSTQ